MAKPYFHAQSSAKKYGGIWEDYMDIHELMDSSKAAFPDNRHRALTHNAWFIGFILPKIFGETFRRKSDNKIVNTRDIGEQHVLEDFKMRFIPSAQDFLQELDFLPWMQNGMGTVPDSHKKLSGNKNILKTTEKTAESHVEGDITTCKGEIKIVEEPAIKNPILMIPEEITVFDGNRGRGRFPNNGVLD